MNQQTDEEIVTLVQKGDTESFGIIVQRYEAKLMRYARKFIYNQDDTEDLIQNIFLKVYANIQGFNTKRRFSPWIYRIAHNEFINAIKKRSCQPALLFDADTIFPHPISKETADREVNERDLKITIESCLNRLDLKYREPLVLYYYEEMGYQDIAEILHIPISTVGVRIQRAKFMMKKIYKKIHF